MLSQAAVRSPLSLLSSGKTSQSHLITPEEESPFPGFLMPYNKLFLLDVLMRIHNPSSVEVPQPTHFRVVSEDSEERSVLLPLLSPEQNNPCLIMQQLITRLV